MKSDVVQFLKMTCKEEKICKSGLLLEKEVLHSLENLCRALGERGVKMRERVCRRDRPPEDRMLATSVEEI